MPLSTQISSTSKRTGPQPSAKCFAGRRSWCRGPRTTPARSQYWVPQSWPILRPRWLRFQPGSHPGPVELARQSLQAADRGDENAVHLTFCNRPCATRLHNLSAAGPRCPVRSAQATKQSNVVCGFMLRKFGPVTHQESSRKGSCAREFTSVLCQSRYC
jgi:hypothetical protein